VNKLKNQLYIKLKKNQLKKQAEYKKNSMNNLIPTNKNCSSTHQSSKDGIEISNKKEETFNNYFASIGSSLASAFQLYRDNSYMNTS